MPSKTIIISIFFFVLIQGIYINDEKGGDTMQLTKSSEALDRDIPSQTETATFAMG